MPDGRYDLILLGWAAFIGFTLVSDLAWGGGNQGDGGGGALAPGGSALGPAAVTEIYRGTYRLAKNRTVMEEGDVRLTIASQQTSVTSVHIASISITLLNPGRGHNLASMDEDFRLSGIEFRDAFVLTSTGDSNPARFGRSDSAPCRLDASINFLGVEGSGHDSTEDTPSAPAPGSPGGAAGDGSDSAEDRPAKVKGEVVAVDCGFSVSFAAKAVNVEYLTQKVAHYSIWANLLTIFQIRCFLIQMRHTEEGPSAAKMSIMCIAVQAMMDAYDSFLHLCLGLSSHYMFNTIAMVSLFKFVLFSLLEARYVLMIYRHRYHEIFDEGGDAFRRQLSWFYSRFYGVLFIGLFVIYNNLNRLDWIVFSFQAYWVPQILYDAWQGSRSALRLAFVVGISVTRALWVLYLWGCPEGIFSGDLYPPLPGAPSLGMCIGVVVLQGVQVGVVMLQQRWGPRWFVPWACMPLAYNYSRGARVDPGTECVICMCEIDAEDPRRAITPCDHNFHRACLEQWMNVKMECPTCRHLLPPIQ